jgi:outer membrane receptor protein involved in Fe transport
MRSTARLGKKIIIFFSLLGGALAASAQTRVDVADEADLHFSIGTERFRAHDYRAALEHFLLSNRLVPNGNVIFDIAETYAQLKQYPDAYRYYTQALEGESDAKERARMEKAIARVASSVAVLRIRTEPPGAIIYVDREDLGARGSSPLVLAFAAGKYRVLAKAPGYEPAWSQEIDARLGSDTRVELRLKRVLGPVRIEGTPAGAEVKADSGESCALPCELLLPVGKVTLTVHAPGFSRARQEVYVAESKNELVEFELQQQTGKLVVNADERGAAVQVDGKLAGYTPAVIDVPVGVRRVRITSPGFEPAERTVEVVHGEQLPLDVPLKAVEEVSAASRTAESVDDAPGSVSLISSKELRAMGYPTIAEALRGVRGVFVNYDTTYSSLGFRGYGPPGSYGNKVLVLVDGHSTNDDWIDSSYVGYDSRTDLDDIERIEVVRGPGSVLYGTGAFVGVVNLVTRARDEPSQTSVALGTVDAGSIRARGNFRRRLDERSGVDFSFSGIDAAGRDYFFPAFQGPASDGVSRGADGFRSGTASGKIWVGDLTLQAQAVARDKSLPAGEFQTLVSDPRSHFIDRRAFAEARYEPRLGNLADFFLRAYWDRYTYDSWLQSSPDNGGLFRERFIGDWGGGEARVSLHPFEWVRLMAGGEWQKHYHVTQSGQSGVDTDTPRTYLSSSSPFAVSAGYAVLDLKPLPWIHLSAGARLDHYTTFGDAVSPRASLILKPTASDVLKLLVGRAFRAPSIYELYYNDGGLSQVPACPTSVTGCTALQPETVWSEEIELTHHFSPLWTGLVSAYHSRISNIIELGDAPAQFQPDPLNPTVTQYQNVSSPVRSQGFELELRREWRQGWMAAASYSFSRADFVQNAQRLRDVPNSPQHLGSLKIAVPLVQRALTAMTRLSIEGPRWDRRTLPTDPPQQRTGTAAIWDLVLSGDLPDWHVRYSMGVYNLADWKYAVPVSREFGPIITMPQNGRAVISSITVGL